MAYQASAGLCLQVLQMFLKQQLDGSVDQVVLLLRLNNRAADTLESGDLAPGAETRIRQANPAASVDSRKMCEMWLCCLWCLHVLFFNSYLGLNQRRPLGSHVLD